MKSPHLFPVHRVVEQRGTLVMVQDGLPFLARRMLILTQPAATNRGGHAHRTASQVFLATRGSAIITTIGKKTERFELWTGGEALFVPPLVWVDIVAGDNSQIIMLSDEEYDEAEYIRAWPQFQWLTAGAEA